MEDQSQSNPRTNSDVKPAAVELDCPSTIHKIFPDYCAKFGVDKEAEANLFYPVYFCNRLPVNESVRVELVRQLRAVDILRQDVQQNGVVHDIVDPNLHGRLLTEKEQSQEIEGLNDIIRKLCRSEIGPDGESDYVFDIDSDMSGQTEQQEVNTKRGRFQWVPSLLQCKYKGNEWKANVLSGIAGVPDRAICPGFYDQIDCVVSNMLPLFEKIGLVRKDDTSPKELQIVFKVQEYFVPPFSKFTGRWHTEGHTERIKATGVFYLDVSEKVEGGDLLFRPSKTPGPSLSNRSDYYERDSGRETRAFEGIFINNDDTLTSKGEARDTWAKLEHEYNACYKEIRNLECVHKHKIDRTVRHQLRELYSKREALKEQLRTMSPCK